MSSNKQLGLFSGLFTSEATPSSDVATKPASKSLALECSDPPRKRKAPASTSAQAEECYLSVQAVARRYSISIQTVWRHTKQNPAFPKPIKILNGTTRWRMSDILSFEVARQEAGQ